MEADITAVAVNCQAEFRCVMRQIAQRPGSTMVPSARRILTGPGSDGERRALATLVEEFSSMRGNRAPSQPARGDQRASDLARPFLDECDRIAAAIDDCLALKVAAVSAALMTMAKPVLHAYAEHKDASGLLDYNDLIGRTSDLLVDPGAAWVLYKLDGGLDHLLLDEVQDTAPEQWRIAHALTAEFFAGATARTCTVFAVGDRKQSIYRSRR
jgi:ATP-dependent helicase/nuclease subunit A